MRTGKGSGGMGGKGTVAALGDWEKLAVVMATRTCIHTAAAAAAAAVPEEYRHPTCDIMVVPETGIDFGGCGGGAGRRVGNDDKFEQQSPDTAGLGTGEASGELVDIVESKLRWWPTMQKRRCWGTSSRGEDSGGSAEQSLAGVCYFLTFGGSYRCFAGVFCLPRKWN